MFLSKTNKTKKERRMAEEFAGKERREFFRHKHETPVKYKTISLAKDKDGISGLINAFSKNLSVSGMLFTTTSLPAISSIVILEIDIRTSQICQEIEERALIINDKLVAKVVRIEEDEDGKYNVGVAFVRKSEKIPRNVLNLIKLK